MTDARKIRGLEIAARTHIPKKNGVWTVPSQSLNGTYVVSEKEGVLVCNCEDYEVRQKPCKHAWAVAFQIEREISKAVLLSPPKSPRRTYAQDWPNYNLSQCHEKDHFCDLLRALCDACFPEETKKRGRGRPSLPLSEAIFSACFKVYSGRSGRRFMSDMRDAERKGLVNKAPCYNSIFNVIERKESTTIIKKLIELSSLPLRSVEIDFAVDSTGFGLGHFYRHYSAKYGHDQFSKDYIKCHAMIGVKTGIITAVEVTNRDVHDSPMFRPLLSATRKRFAMRRVLADKAYSSRDSLLMVDLMGAEAFIPFKSNAKPNIKAVVWNKLYHFYMLNREEFLRHYHKRSIIESTFSSVKRKFGDCISSRTPTAQKNEMLLKVLAHNIVCLVHSMYELGIEEMFGFSLPKAKSRKGLALVTS
jgi:transposase